MPSREGSVASVLYRREAAQRVLEAVLSPEAKAAQTRGAPGRVSDEPGFVLHTHPWSESSLLADVLTVRYGRVFLVAKGAKRPSSNLRGLLTPFSPVKLAWSGRREAKILTRAEWMGTMIPLSGEAIMSGFYLNELILKLTEREDPHPGLF